MGGRAPLAMPEDMYRPSNDAGYVPLLPLYHVLDLTPFNLTRVLDYCTLSVADLVFLDVI